MKPIKRSRLRRDHVLVIGAPRSGTTLLATMIGSHSDVGMVNEDVDVRAMGRVLGRPFTGVKLCVPNQIRLEKKSHFGSQLLKKLGLIAEAPKAYFSITEYLSFPNLKVIGIIRDGNDSVHSMMVRGKSKLKKAARRWGEAIETIHIVKQRYGDRVLVVSFDDLVLEPEATIRATCEFLGLSFEDRMLRGHKLNPYYPQAGLDQEKAHRSDDQRPDLNLEKIVPLACQLYREMADSASKAGLVVN
ncbi:MAG TPA: sulfotransferase [Candidatus Binatia bacterium]|nr:sulfotransferase [Candidatus Binatia bacterium]